MIDGDLITVDLSYNVPNPFINTAKYMFHFMFYSIIFLSLFLSLLTSVGFPIKRTVSCTLGLIG